MSHTTLDFETKSYCDLKKSGAYVYSEHPTTDVICLGYRIDGAECKLWKPGEEIPDDLAVAMEDPEMLWVAHNIPFERSIWRNVMVKKYGWPDITTPAHRWYDTMASCARKGIPLDLKMAAKVTRLSNQKDEGGHKALMAICKPNKKTGEFNLDPELYERVYQYCPQDVNTEESLLHRLGTLSREEMGIWKQNLVVNERGIKLDMKLVADMQYIVDAASVPYAEEFAGLTGGLKATQREKVLEWARSHWSGFPDMKADTVKLALGGEFGDLTPELRRALVLRKKLTSASVKKLAAMRACVGADSRAHYLLQYHGAMPTGREAGRLLQPQNFPRGSIDLGKDEDDNAVSKPEVFIPIIQSRNWELLGMVGGCPIEAVSASLRNCIVAEKGHAIVAGDYSTIEVRVLLALAGQWDKVELIGKIGSKVYIKMAEQIFEMPVDKYANVTEYTIGKNTILGAGFQMGPPKFQARYCPKQPIEFAERAITSYREEFAPKVPELWYGLEEAANKAMWDKRETEFNGVSYKLEGEWLRCRVPSGSNMFYFGAHCTRRPMPWDPNDVRPGWAYKAKKMGKWVTIDAYGGHLAENAVQKLARDLLMAAEKRAEKAGLPVILKVHDELVGEPRIGWGDHKVLNDIMIDVDPWAREMRIPIATEGFTEERYRK